MRLQPAKFNRFLNNIGQQFSHRKASACPCIETETNAPRPDCLQCKGFGWIWGAATVGMSGIAGQKIQREWQNFGLWEAGDVVLTVPSDSPLYAIGPYDRCVMLNTTEAFSFTRRHGVTDTLTFPVVSISRVFWLNPTTQAVIEGTIPTIGQNYALTWSGTVPSSGQQYSMTGRMHPEYFVLQDFAQVRAHHKGFSLPIRVVLRRMDLLSRGLR